jgi:ABC-type nitrate/sulfonate/bicarbonate transport system ATPase subunit
MSAAIATRALCKRFPARDGGEPLRALEGVDMEVGVGEFVSIIGPSGCGKSTLFNILAGLDRPSSGEILLNSRPAERLLGEIGFMPQSDLLMPWRSVLNNAALGLEMNGVSKKEARLRVREQLPRFGLGGFENSWPAACSGGMCQRAALLRTFLAGREVMLLDEPFGALDALTRQVMQEWLLDIWQQDRKTIVFITHDVEEALFLADRVYLMSGRPGRIVLEIVVDLARPRALDETIADPRFVEMKVKLLEPLRKEAAEQLGRRE